MKICMDTMIRGEQSPGSSMRVEVKTYECDRNGVNKKPVSASVYLTVTDESVMQLKDKRIHNPRLPAMALIEQDVEHLEDAHLYLGEDDDDAVRLDLLLGTQGWRRFAFDDAEEFTKFENIPILRDDLDEEEWKDAAYRLFAIKETVDRQNILFARDGIVKMAKANIRPTMAEPIIEEALPIPDVNEIPLIDDEPILPFEEPLVAEPQPQPIEEVEEEEFVDEEDVPLGDEDVEARLVELEAPLRIIPRPRPTKYVIVCLLYG
eukprot:TRINITY_DN2999_c0_g1_i5.p1 TRINITY_DN2999_c0_g1~~TRINITY_DN2999_c0_g1_i5.p1  ORF type:complete len:263 (-),score=90.75 TRINITY_DN2999_c0_g1_i5:251-1039(-)